MIRARSKRPGVQRPPADWPHAAPSFIAADDARVIRSKVVRRYPYRIVYTVEPDAILILAYAHERRKPDYWIHRLSD